MDKNNQKLNIIMLGPAMSVKDGITSVEKLILENQTAKIHIKHIPTYANFLNWKKNLIIKIFSKAKQLVQKLEKIYSKQLTHA